MHLHNHTMLIEVLQKLFFVGGGFSKWTELRAYGGEPHAEMSELREMFNVPSRDRITQSRQQCLIVLKYGAQ